MQSHGTWYRCVFWTLASQWGTQRLLMEPKKWQWAKVGKHEHFNLFVLLVMQKFLRSKNFEINIDLFFKSEK